MRKTYQFTLTEAQCAVLASATNTHIESGQAEREGHEDACSELREWFVEPAGHAVLLDDEE